MKEFYGHSSDTTAIDGPFATIEEVVNYYIDRGYRVAEMAQDHISMGFWDIEALLHRGEAVTILFGNAPLIIVRIELN